jgi:spermidine/putrescine transport system permease protein
MAAEGTGSQLPHARLLFLLLLAPAALWLFGLIVLPHLELGIL